MTRHPGNRATWRAFAVAAPATAVTFLATVLWAGQTTPGTNTSSTPAEASQTALSATQSPRTVTPQGNAPTPASAPQRPSKPVPAATKNAPAVHAVTRASGARP